MNSEQSECMNEMKKLKKKKNNKNKKGTFKVWLYFIVTQRRKFFLSSLRT